MGSSISMPTRAPIHRQLRPLQTPRENPRAGHYGWRWMKVRRMFLRAHPLCVCGEPATDVHHRVAVKQGGDDAEENLQALCGSCHSKITWREGRIRLNVIAICGPPASGKTTKARSMMKRGDIIVDVDLLAMAITGLPVYDKPESVMGFVYEARDSILRALHNDTRFTGTAFVVAMAATREQRDRYRQEFKARVIVMETSVDECVRRLNVDAVRAGRIDEWEADVRTWWSEYEQSIQDDVRACP